MRIFKLQLLFVCTVMVLELTVILPHAGGIAPADYTMAPGLADAEETVTMAYQAVLRAEEAGANVSGLLSRLNEATGLLARAQVANRAGRADEATSLAILSRNIGAGVGDDALRLKRSALSLSSQLTLFTIIQSIVGIAMVTVGSIGVWQLLKKRYHRGHVQMQETK